VTRKFPRGQQNRGTKRDLYYIHLYYIDAIFNCFDVDNIHIFDFRIFNSERSVECIDFNMMSYLFLFFVSVYTISSQNNASILNFSILFDGKVNLVGALGWLG